MKTVLLFMSSSPGAKERIIIVRSPNSDGLMYHVPFQQNWVLRDRVEFEHFGFS